MRLPQKFPLTPANAGAQIKKWVARIDALGATLLPPVIVIWAPAFAGVSGGGYPSP